LPSRRTPCHEDDLASDASLPEQLLRTSRLDERKSLRHQWLDLMLFKELEQRGQVLPKQRWLESLEPLNAVGDDALAPWQNPTASDVQAEDGDRTKPMPTS